MTNPLIYHGGSRHRRGFSAAGNGGDSNFIRGFAQNFTFSDFTLASTTRSIISFFNLVPEGSVLLGSRVKINTAWGGGAITEVYLSLGPLGALGDVMQEYRVDNITPSDTEYAESFTFQSFDYDSKPVVYITARSVGANLIELTQGTGILEMWYLLKVTP